MLELPINQQKTDSIAKRVMEILFMDESIITSRFKTFPWWKAGIFLGLVIAVFKLIQVQNPAICYLMAVEKVKGLELTLPEAMASVRAMAWFNLFLMPLCCLLIFAIFAWLSWRISSFLKGHGSYNQHFGFMVILGCIIVAGQVATNILAATTDLRYLIDLRDLTPGMGLGLFYYFSLERMGPFFWEVVRGFDLFGMIAILMGMRILRVANGFKRFTAFNLVFLYYVLFLACRWVLEGPGHQFWLYFWTSGNV